MVFLESREINTFWNVGNEGGSDGGGGGVTSYNEPRLYDKAFFRVRC